MKTMTFPPLPLHLLFFFFFTTFFQVLTILPSPGCAQQEIKYNDKENVQFPAFTLILNNETMTLPVLPSFELQIDLKKITIYVAYTRVNNAVECLLWSEELFHWVKFGDIDDMPLKTPFARADRLYCWNTNQISSTAAVMVEDVHGNQELIQLESQDPHLMTATFKRPLDIQRAVPFASHQDDCRFRSKKDVSRSFSNNMRAGLVWSEPFPGATDVFCFRY